MVKLTILKQSQLLLLLFVVHNTIAQIHIDNNQVCSIYTCDSEEKDTSDTNNSTLTNTTNASSNNSTQVIVDPIKYCVTKGETNKSLIIGESCPKNQECIKSPDGTSFCMDLLEPLPKVLYPGEVCDPGSTQYLCNFGPQTCDPKIRICRGFSLGHRCKVHADCNPTYYCGSGICLNILPTGSRCQYDVSCGHSSFCYFENPRLNFGLCTPYLSLSNGKKPAHSFDNGKNWSNKNARNYCASYFVNSTGFCAPIFYSLNPKSICKSNNECLTSTNRNNSCICGMESKDERYCDIGPADKEWQDAKIAVTTYLPF